MASTIRHTSVDCRDPFALAQFWSALLDRPAYPGSDPADDEVGVDLGTDAEGDEFCVLRGTLN